MDRCPLIDGKLPDWVDEKYVRPVPQPVEGDLSIYFEPLPGAGAWHGYAASVDNRTGDGWTMVAIQPRTDVVY